MSSFSKIAKCHSVTPLFLDARTWRGLDGCSRLNAHNGSKGGCTSTLAAQNRALYALQETEDFSQDSARETDGGNLGEQRSKPICSVTEADEQINIGKTRSYSKISLQ